MKIRHGMRTEDLAAIVSQALEDDGFLAVLSGGAVVSIYSANLYESKDLDFISQHPIKSLEPTMKRLGFTRGPGRHFEHPDSEFIVEFPQGPVQIGNRLISDWVTLTKAMGSIRILSPTQCVMDRLASFYHWNDRQCLDQALLVSRTNRVNLSTIRTWSAEEGHVTGFREFQRRLKENQP